MRKRLLCFLCALLLFSAAASAVCAVEVPDLSRLGSIAMTMTYEGEAIPGGSLTLYRVALVQAEGGDYSFRYVDAYADCAVELTEPFSGTMAQALAEYTAAASIPGIKQEIDGQGRVTFRDLELGLYLLVQEDAAEGYTAVRPFLVSVPGKKDGSYCYDVDASPKLALEPAPTETTEPTEPPDTTEPPTTEPRLPQTGQHNWPIPILAASGLLLFMLGWYMRRSGQTEKNE